MVKVTKKTRKVNTRGRMRRERWKERRKGRERNRETGRYYEHRAVQLEIEGWKAKTNLLLFIKILFAKHINRRVIFPN